MQIVKEVAGKEPRKIGEAIVNQFREVIGVANVIVDPEVKQEYGHDKTEDFFFMPALVLKPANTNEVSEVVRICNAYKIPVTPRGAGTGLSGGAIPTHQGIVLSMERFNKILAIDQLNLQATVEPGVITEVFQNAVK